MLLIIIFNRDWTGMSLILITVNDCKVFNNKGFLKNKISYILLTYVKYVFRPYRIIYLNNILTVISLK